MTREQILQQAYNRGFEKGAQETAPTTQPLLPRVESAVRQRIGAEPFNQLSTFSDNLGQHESNNRNIAQIGGGPASGYYQFERKSLPTAAARLRRLVPGNHVSSQIADKSIANAMELPRADQRALLLANLDRSPHTRLASGIANNSTVYADYPDAANPFELWRRSHWIGRNPDHLRQNAIRWYQNFPDTPTEAEHLRLMGREGRRKVLRGSHIGAVTGRRTD